MAQEYITINKAKDILPFGVLLVSLALAWGTLNSQLSLTAHKVETIDRKLDKVDNTTTVLVSDVARIKQAINDLTGKSTITRTGTQTIRTSSQSASIQPTPMPQSLVFNNFVEVKPEEKPQEKQEVIKPAPTPVPTPTPLVSLPIIGDIFLLDL